MSYYLLGGSRLGVVPTREQVCRVNVGFQGMRVRTREYGEFPAFGPETTTLSDDDLDRHCDTMLAAGFTHGEIAVSWRYDEPGFLMPVPGRDYSGNLPELVRRVTRMLRNGYTSVAVFCAGDGRSAAPNPDGSYPYNDPVGWTYGYEWLMKTFPRIAQAFVNTPAGDLTKRVIFVPGYDAVFYGWGNDGAPDLQPWRVNQFGLLFRSVLPQGYLAIEHSTGKLPLGEGGHDFGPGGYMQPYDTVLSEFENWPTTGGATWEIAARFLGPRYQRPPDQPSGDDPAPPFILSGGTTRGPYYPVAFEWATYPWTRGWLSQSQVQQGRDYYRGLGYSDVC